MIHLTQAEYDELLAAQEALALLRGEGAGINRWERVPVGVRCRGMKLLAEQLLAEARSVGLHLTIERQMHGSPSMDRIGYVIEAWPDQRAT